MANGLLHVTYHVVGSIYHKILQAIREYSRTPYVGMAQKKMAAHTASDAEISANIIETSLNKHIPFDI